MKFSNLKGIDLELDNKVYLDGRFTIESRYILGKCITYMF